MRKLYFLIVSFFYMNSASAQIINIPDPVFKSKLTSTTLGEFSDANNNNIIVDANQDGEIQLSEALQVHTIYFNSTQPYVTDMTGIQFFENIRRLYIAPAVLTTLNLSGLSNLVELSYYNNDFNYNLSSVNLTGLTSLENLHISNCQLTSLNLSGLINLKYIDCDDNLITNLDVQGLPNLEVLQCRYNQLTNLNLSNLTNLREVHCWYNNLTQIDLNGLPALKTFYCTGNELSSIDLSDCNALEFLECSDNQLSTIDLTNLTQLTGVYCQDNLLITLDITENTLLTNLNCNNNQLTSLFLKNGNNSLYIQLQNNTTLSYVCANNNIVNQLQNYVNSLGYNCQVNSYCSFDPGGTFYTIQGNNRYDFDNNGCDLNDTDFPNLRLNITNGTISGSVFSDLTGSYSIPVQSATHVITPQLEYPTYFTISPTSASVTFPDALSPFTQNFCVTPNGTHNDLEIIILSVNNAQPGFDASYKIIYKNKGTTSQSGNLSLTFDDAVMDFMSANTTPTSQAVNVLSWSFSNLEPFESREITLEMNLNSPTEIPALIGGSVLNYSASITGLTDETPIDNTASLNQEVVNSFDPNDKTCLEGTTITPDKVGEYVHYMIRFENTGTANAQNVVVKDLIDTAKFDVATLIPIDGSHEFYTRITSTNQVEFIFENIQLPFDDANNDGYVAFKIKTKSDLTVGSSFSNTANIYFDYNFPIVTNTATTAIQALTNQDFEFSNYFELAPNPANEFLTITTKSDIEVSSISIYNTLGQLILVIPNAKETNSVDVSQLTTGTYFIKVISDKGSSNSKFIKQ